MSDSLMHARLVPASKSTVVRSVLLAAACATIVSAAQAVGSFGAGHVVVVRVGDGTAALGSPATPVFLDEYAGGVLVGTIPMPTAASGGNFALTNSGTSTSEGFLTLSTNGLFLVQGGYGAIPGTAGVTTSAGTTVPRVIGVTDLNGNFTTTTALSMAHSGGNIRSVASTDGMNFWSTGSNGGVHYSTIGSTASTQLNTAVPVNLRVANIFFGQLYISSASSSFLGVGTLGTGLPTTSGQTPALLTGFPTTGAQSTYDYFFADANTVYVADDRASNLGGIQKWTQSGGTWSQQYTLNVPGASAGTFFGCRGLTGIVVGGTAILWATTTQTSANQIVRIRDTGASSLFTTLATAPANTAFRGIRLIPITCSAGTDCNSDSIPDTCDIALGFSTDLNSNTIPDDCEQNGGTPYCFGDGSGAACPCGNNSALGAGQGCSHGAGGARLTGSGLTSVAADALVLSLSNLQLPAGTSGRVLYFQGTTQTSVPFNDGLRCVGGTQVRLAPRSYVGTTASYPQAGDPSVSVAGGIPATGGAFNYQVWYRTFPTVCGTHSNLSSGLSVVWTP